MYGTLFVTSGPHGAGKTTLIDELLKDKEIDIERVIPYTTRAIRAGEIDGVHCHFLSESAFNALYEKEIFCQYVNMYGRQYGTPAKPIYEKLYNGQSLIVDLTPDALKQLKNHNKSLANDKQIKIKTIFIYPPSPKDLIERLQHRNNEQAKTTKHDLVKRYVAGLNMLRSHEKDDYDFHIKNTVLPIATAIIKSIILRNHDKKHRGKPYHIPEYFAGEMMPHHKNLSKIDVSISDTTKTYLEENQLNDALYLNDYHLDLLTFIETQKNISDTINVTKQKAILMVLEDLAKSRNLPTENHNAPKVLFNNKTLAVMLLSALGFVGIVNNSLKGFNGIVSILRLFTLNPLALYPAGVFFALISATIFFSFDLNQSAKFFGIPFFEHSDVMQNLMEQERLLKSITRSLDKDLIQIKTRSQRERARTLIHVIQSQLNQLYHYKKQLKKQSEATYIKVIEKLFAAVCGLLFLFNGYFTGQAGAMFLLGASSIAAGMATPLGAFVMISLGIIASVGAFAFYAIVQRRGVESLVRSLMGFNKEQVKSFCNIKKHQQLKAEIDDKEQLLYAFSDNILNKESIEPANQEKKENGIKNTLKRSYSANFFNPYNSKVLLSTNDADFAHKSMNM